MGKDANFYKIYELQNLTHPSLQLSVPRVAQYCMKRHEKRRELQESFQ